MFWKMSWFVHIYFNTFTWFLKSMLYHAVIKIFWDTCDFSSFMPKLCSGGFNKLRCRSTNVSLGQTHLFIRTASYFHMPILKKNQDTQINSKIIKQQWTNIQNVLISENILSILKKYTKQSFLLPFTVILLNS